MLTAPGAAYPHLSSDGRMMILRPMARRQRPLSRPRQGLSLRGKRLFFHENVETEQFEVSRVASIEISLGN